MWPLTVAVAVLSAAGAGGGCHAFPVPQASLMRSSCSRYLTVLTASHLSEQEIKSMRVPELKKELALRSITVEGVFEKEELVKRLLQYSTSLPHQSQLEQDIQLPFTMTQGHHMTIKASVGGSTGVELRLALDTGASKTLITADARRRIGVLASDLGTVSTGAGGGGVMHIPSCSLSSFTLGGKQCAASFCNDLEVLVLPRGISDACEGIIGLDVLHKFEFCEIDWGREVVTLHSDSQRGHRVVEKLVEVPFTGHMVGGLLLSECMLNGNTPAQLLFDTGLPSTIVSVSGAKHAGIAMDGPLTQGSGVDGTTFPATRACLGRLDLAGGKLRWENMHVQVCDLPLFRVMGFQEQPHIVIMGLDAMSRGGLCVLQFRAGGRSGSIYLGRQ